ncbi:Magnesium transporter protein 1 [Golovinomyces cichoracearum]|uniref:Magnesium transporter protein 1 n=1 Tax=Golovinomyces cichoracearum TaxID=62708 RepID=A0A420J3G7_9PEZI|nr:Magnesium transporter protein 1 [Golovinomyces cichoracearum]
MILIKKIFFIYLHITGITAKSFVEDRYEQYHARSIHSTPLKLDESSYNKLVSDPRDYSVAVLLTAKDARFGCQLCHQFDPEWDILSKSWKNGDKLGESRLIFATLDFTVGRNIFQSFGLQTVPVLMLFQPTHGKHAVPEASPLRFDFNNGPHSAERIHSWISRHLSGRLHPPIRRPTNWKNLSFILTSAVVLISFVSVSLPYILPVLQNRNTWAAISLISILLFTSGHMFNHIRKVPYITGNERGGINYFAGGFSSQLGLETQIIAAICEFNWPPYLSKKTLIDIFTDGLLAFATISLALKAPRVLHPTAQQVVVIAWSLVIFLTHSLLLRVFRIKNGGYPFWLPPFS